MAIKTSEFQPLASRWQDIYNHLKKEGFEVYAPEQKVGECTSPYIVVKNDGSYLHQNFSTHRDMYSIECYVPRLEYSKLEVLVMDVKKAMHKLYPMIQDYGQQMAAFYDSTVKAHYITIEYENYKKAL